jgi:hypothetical protein
MSDFLTSKVTNKFHPATKQDADNLCPVYANTDLDITNDFHYTRLRDMVMLLIPKARKSNWAEYITAELKRTDQILFKGGRGQKSHVADMALVRCILQDTEKYLKLSSYDQAFIESVRLSAECLLLAWRLADKTKVFPAMIELSPESMLEMETELLGQTGQAGQAGQQSVPLDQVVDGATGTTLDHDIDLLHHADGETSDGFLGIVAPGGIILPAGRALAVSEWEQVKRMRVGDADGIRESRIYYMEMQERTGKYRIEMQEQTAVKIAQERAKVDLVKAQTKFRIAEVQVKTKIELAKERHKLRLMEEKSKLDILLEKTRQAEIHAKLQSERLVADGVHQKMKHDLAERELSLKQDLARQGGPLPRKCVKQKPSLDMSKIMVFRSYISKNAHMLGRCLGGPTENMIRTAINNVMYFPDVNGPEYHTFMNGMVHYIQSLNGVNVQPVFIAAIESLQNDDTVTFLRYRPRAMNVA